MGRAAVVEGDEVGSVMEITRTLVQAINNGELTVRTSGPPL
jgi:hypothetical protein